MTEYEIVNVSNWFKWGRINGTFYVNQIHLDEFLTKHKNRVA